MRLFGCIGLVLLLGGAITAQTVLFGPGASRGFQAGRAGPQTMVRDSGGDLYVIYRYQVSTVNLEWRLAIAKSADQGKNWNMTWQSGFDSYTVGGYGNLYPCLAIDSKDNLHCIWWTRGTTTSYYTIYNRYDAGTQAWGTEWKVSTSAHKTVPHVVVDQSDYVWIAYCRPSYNTYLDRSNVPFAADGKFTRLNPSFPGGSSSSNFEMAVDALGRIHTSYYDTGSGFAGIKHRWIDPAAATPAWSTVAMISNHAGDTARAEYESSLSGDNAGNMYILYTVDSQAGTTSRTKDTQFYVRKWDNTTQVWSNPVLIHSVPVAVWHPGYATNVKDYNSGAIIASACDETTGEFYFTYRDFTSGDFVIGRWRGVDTEAHTIYAKLMNTSPLAVGTRNYFYAPHMRGSLWPKTNRTSLGLDLMYVVGDQTGAKVYTDYFEHFPVASVSSARTPKINTKYPLDLVAISEGSQPYAVALSVGGLAPGVQLGRRFISLVPDQMFFATVANAIPMVFINFQGVLASGGTGKAEVAIPNLALLVGISVDAAWVTYDMNGFRAISNPWNFVMTP